MFGRRVHEQLPPERRWERSPVLAAGSRCLIATTAAMALVSGLGQLGTERRFQQISKHV